MLLIIIERLMPVKILPRLSHGSIVGIWRKLHRNYVNVNVLVTRVQLFVNPWTVACQALPSISFSRQEYWNGLPFPSPEDLPKPWIEPGSPALKADCLLSEQPGKPYRNYTITEIERIAYIPNHFNLFNVFTENTCISISCQQRTVTLLSLNVSSIVNRRKILG